MASRAQQRTSRRVLDAALVFIEEHGVEQLSMRRLAEEAEVSVKTLYNHFGDKDGLLAALVQRSLDSIDAAVHQLEATDPIERIWEAIEVSVAQSVNDVPRAVVRAIVADDDLFHDASARWTGWKLIVGEMRAATKRGALRADIDPGELAAYVGMSLFYLQRRWSAGEIDDEELRSGVLHAFDIVLLAVAAPRTRGRILQHYQALQNFSSALAEA